MTPLKVIIFVLGMGTVCAGLLVGVNLFTAPLIAKNEEMKLKTAVLDTLEIPYTKQEAFKIFDKNVKVLKKGNYTFYTALDGSVAFSFSGAGLWGPVSGIISLEKDLKTIRTLKVLHQEETPGLGGRIAEKDYISQFKGKEVLPKLAFIAQGKRAGINEVNAITGATGTSRAFEKLINETLKVYLAALKE